MTHYRATIGYVRKGWEFFGGYDQRRIGRVHLSGPLIGVRCWF